MANKDSSGQKSSLKENETNKGSRPEDNKNNEPRKELFVWEAPARPYKARDRKFWTTLITIAVLFSLILFVAEGAMPVILIISLVFLFYVLSTVEPEDVFYRITNKGIEVAQAKTSWQEINRFWFSRRFNNDLLIFETFGFPGRMELVVNDKDKAKIRGTVSKYVLEEEAPPSSMDRMANWFTKKLPGNS
jgi:hypothetical protein